MLSDIDPDLIPYYINPLALVGVRFPKPNKYITYFFSKTLNIHFFSLDRTLSIGDTEQIILTGDLINCTPGR